MVTAVGTTKDGRKLLVLGLSELNCRLMRNGFPLHISHVGVNANEAPFSHLIVFWGELDAEVQRAIDAVAGVPLEYVSTPIFPPE